MNSTEQFNFAHVISKGMSKQAVSAAGLRTPAVEAFVSSREALKKMLLAGGVGAATGAAGATMLNRKHASVKQAMPLLRGAARVGGWAAGVPTRALMGGVNAGVLGLNKAVQGGGAALRTAGKVLTHPMHLPENGVGKSFGRGFQDIMNFGNKPKLPENFTAKSAPASPIPEAVRSNPSYVKPSPNYSDPLSRPPIVDPKHMIAGAPEPEQFSPLLPSTTNPNRAVSTGAYLPNFTHRPGSAGSPIIDVASEAAPQAPGIASNFRNTLSSRWNGLQPWQRNTAIAGGAAAATANTASVYGNNSAADWQQEHPLMGWLGKTFGGMPDYQRRSYLLPSFLQK